MANPLIIKGALYENNGEIVRPHFTGSFFIVDCTKYVNTEALEDLSDDFENSFVEVDYVKYYECEGSTPILTTNFELVSDLSHLEYYDEGH